MPWFKTDDKLHDHRKTRRALRSHARKRRDAAAMGLWIVAGTWAADNLTDGFIPADELGRWDDDGEELAERLIEAGFWESAVHDEEPGYRFVNWAEKQPTKEQVEARRAIRAEAGRKGGLASGVTRRGEAKPKQVASPLLEPPTRPDPSPSAAAAADTRGGGSALPDDLQILRTRMSEYTALAAVRWDRLDDKQVQTIQALIARHGDRVLVDCALRTCRQTPPTLVNAFIGTWEALGAPRAVGATPEPRCGICNQSRRACERAAQTVDPDDRHTFQESA